MLACGVSGATPLSECTYGEQAVCECPGDATRPVVLSGGGQAVFVDPAASLAWLDFRPVAGEVRGAVEGGACLARLDRVTTDPGEATSRAVPCGADGSFHFEHVAAGEWDLRLLPRGGLVSPDRVPTRRVRVEGGVVELGALPRLPRDGGAASRL
jgi:hypothetical protein